MTPIPAVGSEQQDVEGPTNVRALFAVIYATSVSSIYFGLGVVARHAQGLTPAIFIVAGLFFQLTAMSYAEAASLNPQRGGSAAFARYAFNELVSFIAGWAIVLDYMILVAVAALTAPAYLAVFWPALGHGDARIAAAAVVVTLVGVDAVRGSGTGLLRRHFLLTGLALLVQGALIVCGLVLVFHGSHLSDTVHFARAPSVKDLGFAIPVGVIAFAGMEAASGLAAEARSTPRQLKRVVAIATAAITVTFVGIALVGVGALPVHHGLTALGTEHENAPVLGIAQSLRPHGFADVFRYLVGISGAVALVAVAAVAMLGVSRVGYAMATHRQIPSAVGRLSARRNTPWVVIVIATLAAIGLVIPANLDALVGIYAFGALVAFTIVHLSVIAMRLREPALERTYAIPLGVPVMGRSLPLPAVLGAVMSAAGLVALVIFHSGARYVGCGWLLAGVLLYVVYRKAAGRPVFRRVVIPAQALAQQTDASENFGSILVPVFGTALDDDIIQTAARLAGDTHDDVDEEGAIIEAVYAVEVPLSLPLDAPLPPAQIEKARAALRHAREVGDAYDGVSVSTAAVRGRGTAQVIVKEARRRGAEVIVLAVQPPSAVRGGARLGGQGVLDSYIGQVTRYVINKAPCRVSLTAPAFDGVGVGGGGVGGGGAGVGVNGVGGAGDSAHPGAPTALEYRSALVPIFGTDADASSLRTAAKLVGPGAVVEAIYVLHVPNHLGLDAGLKEQEEQGNAVLESAKLMGRKVGLKVTTRLIRTRSPGATIVEEAQRTGAEIIYLGTTHAPPSERALGPTASYLLSHRPCRVVIETPPEKTRRPAI